MTRPSPTSELKLLSHDVFVDPYPTYALLREHAPVHWDDQLHGYLLTRYDDVHAALRDHETFSSRRIGLLAARGGADPSPAMTRFVELASQWMWMLDPPEHTRVRKLMSQGFSPRDVRQVEPRVEGIVARLVDSLIERGSFDLIPDLSRAVPIGVLLALYGLPDEDGPLLTEWADTMKLFLGGAPDLLGTHGPAAQSLRQMMEYLGAVIAERRRDPGDDLISRLAQAEENGERLDDEELCSNLLLLLVATYETSVDMLGNGLRGLLAERDQWELLRAEPDRIPAAVDEILRWDGPVQLTHRLVTRDVELHGTTIRQGQLAYLVRGSANRDPAQFSDPDRLDVTRTETGHVALGTGVHYCIGAGLAKVEGAYALRELTRRIPDLRLDPERPYRWRADNLQFRGLATLPATTGRP
ncbi:cytochrome P450 [Streptomyces chumphonensis]|uniref:Cytochrome P450 n=1 Tax=Streptomyces chumphonensis TaxID=1214925 RepID=A0A927F5L2_9ACTN|nr:cytochrome P450 [Streptomyces chumphonensis]MBD3934716.1 cytochrome P450 [Streptomyces chumphonensis]